MPIFVCAWVLPKSDSLHASKFETSVYVCLHACLPTSQPDRPACLSVYLSVCLLVSMSAYLSVCLFVCMFFDDVCLLHMFFYLVLIKPMVFITLFYTCFFLTISIERQRVR